jgi:putative transposase
VPRIRRGLVKDGIYHVVSRGNGGQTVFLKPGDYQAFLKLMEESKKRFLLKIFAFCLMPNHLHFILCNIEENIMSQWMQWLMTSHVQRYRRHYGGSGHVWQGRFRSFLVECDEYLLTVLRYVEANPVRAGLVRSAKEWPWSSHVRRIKNTLLGNEPDKSPISLPVNWSDWVDRPLEDEELARIRRSVNKQVPYGNDAWVLKICEELGLQSVLRSRGRPKKGTG